MRNLLFFTYLALAFQPYAALSFYAENNDNKIHIDKPKINTNFQLIDFNIGDLKVNMKTPEDFYSLSLADPDLYKLAVEYTPDDGYKLLGSYLPGKEYEKFKISIKNVPITSIDIETPVNTINSTINTSEFSLLKKSYEAEYLSLEGEYKRDNSFLKKNEKQVNDYLDSNINIPNFVSGEITRVKVFINNKDTIAATFQDKKSNFKKTTAISDFLVKGKIIRMVVSSLYRSYGDTIRVRDLTKKTIELIRDSVLISPNQEYILGRAYLDGDDGYKKDLNKSFKLILSAAERGHSQAQNDIGVYYSRGYGTPENDFKAYEWYVKSANKGNSRGQYNLAEFYEKGKPFLVKDSKKAEYWYKKSADQGLKEAQFRLGYLYLGGTDIKKDTDKAFSLYLKSAKQGYVKAQYSLGIMFENGVGTVKDFERARYWYGKAADQGHKKAEKRLIELKKEKDSNKSSGAGSGFIIAKNGYLATNNHVIDSCKNILIDGLEATVVSKDKNHDLAILKVNTSYDVAAPLSYKSTELGDDVKVFGYPLSYMFSDEFISLTKGSVSGLSGFDNNQSEFRFTASVQPGNSGGPIVGEDGRVVGLVMAVLGREASERYEFLPQNVNFGIQVSLLLDMMRVKKIAINNSRIDKNSVVQHYKKVTKHIKCYK